jgi:hypothetical protein
MKKTCLVALVALSVACGGGGGGGGTPNPPPDLTETIEQVLAVYDDCAGDMLGDLFDLFERFASQLDPAEPPLPVTVLGTDAAAGRIDLAGDLNGDMVDELTAVFRVTESGTEEPPAGFDADDFASGLTGFAAAVAATSGTVDVQMDFGSIVPGLQDLLGSIRATVQDGDVQGFDATLDGVSPECGVNITVTTAPGTAFAGTYPSFSASGRVDSLTIAFDFVVVFDGTSTAAIDVIISQDIELSGSVDLDTGALTIDQ